MVTRDDILASRSTFDIFKHFLRDYYENAGINMSPGVHVYVPEISGEQKTPSFNVYFSRKSNEYRYKDFTGNDGSVFDLVMNIYNVSFPESLRIIDKEMNLGLYDSAIHVVSKVKPKPKREVILTPTHNSNYTLITKNWTKRHLGFWAEYGTGIETLQKYNYKPLKRLSAYTKDNIPYTRESSSEELIFVWEENTWGKYYMPEILGIQKKRFGYFGKKAEGYVFGLKQLPNYGKDLYIVGGEKDVINSSSHGMNAICFTSEESMPRNYPKFMELLDSGRFKNYYIAYDQDSCGRRQMLKISKDIPQIKIKSLPIPDGKDISDYFKDSYNKFMY